MMHRPITPDELGSDGLIIGTVTKVINRMLREKWDGAYAVLHSIKIIERIRSSLGSRQLEVTEVNYKTIYSIYKAYGWDISAQKDTDNVDNTIYVFKANKGSK